MLYVRMLDLDAFHAFMMVAKESSLSRAAAKLYITQPPLSRKIKRLEQRLGVTLFSRRSSGMELTEMGRRLFDIMGPFMMEAAKVEETLSKLVRMENKPYALGISTAFEQGSFTRFIDLFRWQIDPHFTLVRKGSPQLVRGVKQGDLAAAFVAMPIDAQGLPCCALEYAEPLLAALPASWPEAGGDNTALVDLSGKPLFWFQRRLNPVYFDHMQGVFSLYSFRPLFVEEPAEHDVLLARIAFGEGWALLPASFAAVRRDGVKFVPLAHNGELVLRMGYVYADDWLALNF